MKQYDFTLVLSPETELTDQRACVGRDEEATARDQSGPDRGQAGSRTHVA